MTVRHGSDVGRERFQTLDEALAEARERVDRVRRTGRLDEISAFRTYEPGERVQARVEISGPGLLRTAKAGIDVMGDGTLVPYRGAIRKRRLQADSLDQAVEGLREALG